MSDRGQTTDCSRCLRADTVRCGSEAPALQLGLYKLLGTDDETQRLNASKQEVKHEGEIGILKINYINPDAGTTTTDQETTY